MADVRVGGKMPVVIQVLDVVVPLPLRLPQQSGLGLEGGTAL
jgi:hypothetical protein